MLRAERHGAGGEPGRHRAAEPDPGAARPDPVTAEPGRSWRRFELRRWIFGATTQFGRQRSRSATAGAGRHTGGSGAPVARPDRSDAESGAAAGRGSRQAYRRPEFPGAESARRPTTGNRGSPAKTHVATATQPAAGTVAAAARLSPTGQLLRGAAARPDSGTGRTCQAHA